ncbi:MAG: electron transport complex subunit RsxA [Ignavibacteria bacterium]|jgi:electron transport complex protein RnfA|nr:electron transport complex subunit RsxA [Ignavibacteria bacterium]MDH7526599.1 electron transport complex subunit RsxA [Ignavibacteria bacterium]
MELIIIFLSAALINNFVLSYFLGICPFIGVSSKISSAVSMGLAVIFVMTITAIVSWLINHMILIPYHLEFLTIPSFILVIASLVQFVEMVIKKVSSAIYRALGIFLPLITTNCAILGLALFASMREYTLIQSVIFALGAGSGFTLALVIMAGIREELELANVPEPFQGAPITLIVAGLLALTFMGFAGII